MIVTAKVQEQVQQGLHVAKSPSFWAALFAGLCQERGLWQDRLHGFSLGQGACLCFEKACPLPLQALHKAFDFFPLYKTFSHPLSWQNLVSRDGIHDTHEQKHIYILTRGKLTSTSVHVIASVSHVRSKDFLRSARNRLPPPSAEPPEIGRAHV